MAQAKITIYGYSSQYDGHLWEVEAPDGAFLMEGVAASPEEAQIDANRWIDLYTVQPLTVYYREI